MYTRPGYITCLALECFEISQKKNSQQPCDRMKVTVKNLIHTLQPLSKDYGLASHTSHVVCFNFIHDSKDQQFNVDSERQIFWATFSWQVYLLSRVFSRNLLKGNRRRNIFFLLRFDAWSGIRTRALRLISQHSTY